MRISWDIAPDTLACAIPTLGLQPLVENCFRHVVERRVAMTRIAISARRIDGRLQVAVKDDGDTHTLPPKRGVGLGNLERRLRSLYGEDAALTLQVRTGGGLIIRVVFPCAC